LEIIAKLWLLWLIIFGGSLAYVMSNQIRRMKNMSRSITSTLQAGMTSPQDKSMESAKDTFMEGMKGMAVGAIIASLSGLLLLLAIVLNIIDYAR
jgi:hypothetical protein